LQAEVCVAINTEDDLDLSGFPEVDAELEESLPAEYYLTDRIFEREKERIFFSEWVCAGREEQLAQPGDYLVVDIAGESVLVVRDEGGELRAHYNVCRHRGCQLALPEAVPVAEQRVEKPEGPAGHFHKAIRCPYHSWVYGFDGRLKGAPFLRETEGFRKRDLSLFPVGIATWGGFFFVNLSPATAAPLTKSMEPVSAMAQSAARWRSSMLGQLVLGSVMFNRTVSAGGRAIPKSRR
jgi:glycine betaine catabolism A